MTLLKGNNMRYHVPKRVCDAMVFSVALGLLLAAGCSQQSGSTASIDEQRAANTSEAPASAPAQDDLAAPEQAPDGSSDADPGSDATAFRRQSGERAVAPEESRSQGNGSVATQGQPAAAPSGESPAGGREAAKAMTGPDTAGRAGLAGAQGVGGGSGGAGPGAGRSADDNRALAQDAPRSPVASDPAQRNTPGAAEPVPGEPDSESDRRAEPGLSLQLPRAATRQGEEASERGRGVAGPREGRSRTAPQQHDNVPAGDPDTFISIDLQPGEELWVIARGADAVDSSTAADDAAPGCGALLARLPDRTTQVPVPLRHTSVTGTVDGYIATVQVTQQFHNPWDSKIEAVYAFPLPEDAAVSEFLMVVGERRIRGIIREREQAERIYNAARERGHVASLLTQERPNVFTQKVANIEPGHQIDVEITYLDTLRYDDGAWEFVFPMVVGPRFNPGTSRSGVGAVARGAHGTSGQPVDVSYLAPEERSGHDVDLTLNLNAGVRIESVHSTNHRINVRDICESQKQVVLADADRIPNRDFVLRYQVAGDDVRSALLTHTDDHGRYFTLMVYPPKDLASVPRSPMEMVFVLDCSGSMKGRPMAQARAAVAHALKSLTPRDTFQIIRFSSDASQLGTDPVPATPENVRRGLEYVQSLSGSGGTQMIEGIKAALSFPHDEGRFRLVAFLTDGYIGNEQQILEAMVPRLGPSRVFSFGVGQSPNRYLLDRMAGLGRGAVAYLSLNDDAVGVMDHFNQRISHPAMTDLAIDWGSMDVTDVYPRRLPDLIVGRPVVITGRYTGEPGVVTIGGRVGMQPASFAVAVDDDPEEQSHPGIATVWARLRIRDLMLRATVSPDFAATARADVLQTALNYNLLSRYTAFVAVDSLSRTDGDYGTTVAVPVPVPEGVRYDTTVNSGTR